MDARQYRLTEKLLYEHFREKRAKHRALCYLHEVTQIEMSIKDDIAKCMFNMSELAEAMNATGDTNREGYSASNTLIECTKKLMGELEELNLKKVDAESKVRDLEKALFIVDDILSQLDSEQMNIVILKYDKELSNRKIGEQINCDESTVKRKNDRTVEYIHSELEAYGL